jgi:hypothetical protein
MDSKPEDPRSPQQTSQRRDTARPDAENLATAAELAMTRRRSLLKAAASVAPVLATLPNGAALANASAFQCANALLDQANLNNPDEEYAGEMPVSPSPGVGTDDFYRVAGKTWVRFEIIGGNTTYYNFTAFDGQNVTVDINGNLSTRTPPTTATPVQLLVLYQPILDTNGLVVDLPADSEGKPVATVESPGCIIEGTRSGWTTQPTAPNYCIYPIARLQPPSGNNNIGMTASCLASFATSTP